MEISLPFSGYSTIQKAKLTITFIPIIRIDTQKTPNLTRIWRQNTSRKTSKSLAQNNKNYKNGTPAGI